MEEKNKAYVVYRGRNPGVYDNWPDCHMQVTGCKNAAFEGFETFEAADYAWYLHCAKTNGRIYRSQGVAVCGVDPEGPGEASSSSQQNSAFSNEPTMATGQSSNTPATDGANEPEVFLQGFVLGMLVTMMLTHK